MSLSSGVPMVCPSPLCLSSGVPMVCPLPVLVLWSVASPPRPRAVPVLRWYPWCAGPPCPCPVLWHLQLPFNLYPFVYVLPSGLIFIFAGQVRTVQESCTVGTVPYDSPLEGPLIPLRPLRGPFGPPSLGAKRPLRLYIISTTLEAYSFVECFLGFPSFSFVRLAGKIPVSVSARPLALAYALYNTTSDMEAQRPGGFTNLLTTNAPLFSSSFSLSLPAHRHTRCTTRLQIERCSDPGVIRGW